jgi:hypothetical protein
MKAIRKIWDGLLLVIVTQGALPLGFLAVCVPILWLNEKLGNPTLPTGFVLGVVVALIVRSWLKQKPRSVLFPLPAAVGRRAHRPLLLL